MTEVSQGERWRGTARLTLAAVLVLVIVILFFVSLVELPGNEGYPLGLVAAATGIPGAAAILVFWFARRQETIDRRHGLYED
ncbi:MAG TPA: sodium/substrate symporter small subunit [Bauldia sp.]|nr:sodium/substrate symporter small subunit [Bauldia sp.]